METRPGKQDRSQSSQSRGSGPGVRKRRRDALGVRKDVIIRMPEELAYRLKIAAACEGTTVNDFCLQVITPHIEQALEKHGMSAVRLAR